jgi:glycine cleavage system H protein
VAAAESYPDQLKYHREHDWARVEGDTATLGVTWYAQDALGELVHYEPPDVGSSLARDESYGEVDQGVVEAPETVNSDPYGEGWLVKIRLSDPNEVDDLLDAQAYKKLLEEM